MPFERKYSPETREAATKRAVELKTADPKDRTVIRVVSEEFAVGAQSLRGWLSAATPDEKRAKQARRPKFSPVVTTRAEHGEAPQATAPVDTAAIEKKAADLVRQVAATERIIIRHAPSQSGQVAALESTVAALRQDNETLKSAMRVLLED